MGVLSAQSAGMLNFVVLRSYSNIARGLDGLIISGDTTQYHKVCGAARGAAWRYPAPLILLL